MTRSVRDGERYAVAGLLRLRSSTCTLDGSFDVVGIVDGIAAVGFRGRRGLSGAFPRGCPY